MPIEHRGFTFLHLVRRGDDFEPVKVRCEDCGKVQVLRRSFQTAVPGTYYLLLGGGIQVSCGDPDCEQNESYDEDEVATG